MMEDKLKDALIEALEEVKLMRQGKMKKKSWDQFIQEQKELDNNYKLYGPILDMREALMNDVLPNDEVVDPYEIDLSYNGISIYKSWYDFDEKEVNEEKIYFISYVDFFKAMFDIPVKRT